MTRYKVGFIIWGIFCFIDSLVFLTALLTKNPSAIISNAIPFGITVFGTAFNIIKYIRTKKPRSDDTPQQATTPAIPTTAGAQEIFMENQNYILNSGTNIHNSTITNTVVSTNVQSNFINASTAANTNFSNNSVHQTSLSSISLGHKTLTAPYSHIPQNIINLLWFSNGPFKNYNGETSDIDFNFGGRHIHIGANYRQEPSAIDINLPLADTTDLPEQLGYYPSYERLTPQQRTIYLNWLSNITAPIDIGYVFVFYYGLERHMLFGNSEAAVSTILTLRKFHNNGSFLGYSGDALILYAILNNRYDFLKCINLEQVSDDARLLIQALTRQSLSGQDIMQAHKKFGFENNRYIKNQPDLFLSQLECLIYDKYFSNDYPIYTDDINAAKGNIQLVLANYSLMPEQRFFELPDITTSPRIYNEINSLLINTHEIVKQILKERRKENNS